MFSSEGYCDYADMVQCHDRAVGESNRANFIIKRRVGINQKSSDMRAQILTPSSGNSYIRLEFKYAPVDFSNLCTYFTLGSEGKHR